MVMAVEKPARFGGNPQIVRGVRMTEETKVWMESMAAKSGLSQTRFLSALIYWFSQVEDPDYISLVTGQVPESYRGQVAERFGRYITAKYSKGKQR